MGYTDGTATVVLGNRTLLFMFLCAFAFVTLWQEISFGPRALRRYFVSYHGPLLFNSTECRELRTDMTDVRLGMFRESDVFDRWRRLQVCDWEHNRSESDLLRLQLSRCCNAPGLLVASQRNVALGSRLRYEGEEKRTLQVGQELFNMLPPEMPYGKQQFRTCSVVGNGGILTGSGCGHHIDSADFVFRCNLPPLQEEFTQDVGSRTDLVTINPSIISDRFERLERRRRPFAEALEVYGNASLVLPAFYVGRNTELALRVRYTMEDLGLPRPVLFFHPAYLASVGAFWRARGVRARRLSSGLMVASAALELCREVHAYGFWPFGVGARGDSLAHHYYDDAKPRPGFHAMPAETVHLMHLHARGTLHLHTEPCPAR
ncbi:alpha-2,8-sialyltransferase 8E [Lethenteron reissneri]|uniref:alpha-2,8-sialyltransferase 8E n=1 Tax=Lethenteron reissneri TaxID=7753 RepID=UPI002AB62DD7|nr:alpha-2,8-sialyltransferase 8E [Lethenteron reissneri]